MMFWNVAKVPNFVKYGNRCALHDTFCWLKMGYFRAYFGVYLADPLMLLLNLLTYENFKNKGRSRKMSSVTFENDFFGSLLDMAESHIDVHKNQHDRMQKGEEPVIELRGNSVSDDSWKLLINKAIEQGVRSPDDWKKFNATRAKERQKPDYETYLRDMCGKTVKALRRSRDKDGQTQQKRTQLSQQLAYFDRQNVLVDGSLWYIANTDDPRPKGVSEKQWRAFEVEALKRFDNDPTYRTLNPGVFRSEIHLDEKGEVHKQDVAVWFHRDNQNRVQYAKSKGIHDSLLKLYNGNEDELNRRLDLLCDISRTVDKTPGKTRSDVLLFRDIESGKQPTEHYTQRERDNREIVLWRFENIHALQQVALQVAKERNIDYQLSTVYETDGQHQNRTTYMAARQAQAKVKGYKRAVYADKKLQKQINSVYTNAIGHDPDPSLSPLERVNEIAVHLKSLKEEAQKLQDQNEREQQKLDQTKRQNELLQQQTSNWQQFRLLLVNIIEKLWNLMFDRDMRDDYKNNHQRWRDSMTAQVDNQMHKMIDGKTKDQLHAPEKGGNKSEKTL